MKVGKIYMNIFIHLLKKWYTYIGSLLETSYECEYINSCNLYQKDSHICNHDAGPYCGQWRKLYDETTKK